MVIHRWIHDELDGSSKQSTIGLLDGVRALACLIVIFFHIYRIPRDVNVWPTQPFQHPLLDAFLFFGRYGVTLFFVLSGFLLFLPFAKALVFEKSWPSIRRFYTRRIFRIVPAYYLSLILIVLIFQQQYLQPQRWGELGLFFTFLMDASPATHKQLNAPFWTLAIEWQFYMLLPLLALGMRQIVWRMQQNYRLLATIACLLAIIAWGLFSRAVGIYFSQHPAETFLVPRSVLNGILFFIYGVSGKYFEDFGVGMLLVLCFVYARHSAAPSRIIAKLQKVSLWIWGVGLGVLLFMILANYNQYYPNTLPFFNIFVGFQPFYVMDELCISLAFALCLLALLFGPDQLKRPFEWSPLRWTGMLSYSLYIWHLPFIFLFIRWGQPLLTGWAPEIAYGVYWLWIALAVLPFCFFFFKWIEKPGIKLGERFTRQKIHAVPRSPSKPEHIPADRIAPRKAAS